MLQELRVRELGRKNEAQHRWMRHRQGSSRRFHGCKVAVGQKKHGGQASGLLQAKLRLVRVLKNIHTPPTLRSGRS